MGQIICVFFLTLLFACSPSLSTSRIGTAPVQEGTPTTPPDFNTNSNFFVDANKKVIGTLRLDSANENNYPLRGKEVNAYISKLNTTKNMCVVAYFPNSPEKKILLTSAQPLYTNDFRTNTQDWYYVIKPWDESFNTAGCNNSQILAALNAKFPGAGVAFSLPTLCPNCTVDKLFSTGLELVFTTGEPNKLVLINNLYFLISYIWEVPAPIGMECKTNQDCQNLGYNCCGFGRCVKDKTLKSGVDLKSQEYLQSLKDILVQPSRILNYPNFYNICAESVPLPPDASLPESSTTTTNLEMAQMLYEDLRDLYNCTVPQYKEMSYCTLSYKNVNLQDPNFVYNTLGDDRNFTSTYSGSKDLSTLSIVKVVSNGVLLFDDGKYLKQDSLEFGPPNDNLVDSTYLKLLYPPSVDAKVTGVKLTYQIDGSCEKINNTLSKCFIIYTQGQNEGLIDDHFPASNIFRIPFYADLNRTMKVQVNGVNKIVNTQWTLVRTSPPVVEFVGDSLMVKDTEEVKITFFVDTNIHKVLQAKQDALDTINRICRCGNIPCLLKPIFNLSNSGSLADPTEFICDYLSKGENPILQQQVNLDSKTTPQLYFDNNGVYHSETNISTPPQEGKQFKYIEANLLRPNNQVQYIGFNEINGSFTVLPSSAKPASMVNVQVGKTYDIFVDQGIYSTCFDCGYDYYNKAIRLFPKNTNYLGGGYRPDNLSTNPFNTPVYRKDDLLFGRACFVPATMIPWSNRPISSTQAQRLGRQSAQHFLFANGYQRDWYGFDYGSIIGSFNGINWFSVGNQRRIKATSNRLFLAVNAYYGDLTETNNFTIQVSDATSVTGAGSAVNNDILSDGAQCQQQHLCKNDQDCITQVGYDYFCESVSNIYTNFPLVDQNGDEIPNTNASVRLLNLVGGRLLFGDKRCVYRGRGAPCISNYTTTDSSNAYDKTDSPGLHACSSNNYCELFEKGVAVEKFNNKIARYGKPVKAQNDSPFVLDKEENTFGLQAKEIGRPYNFNGNEAINSQAQSNLSYNKVASICIPGRTPETQNTTFIAQQGITPATEFFGDVVNNIGMTPMGLAPQPNYLSSCAIIDESGNYYQLFPESAVKTLGNSEVKRLAGAQAVPTNSLELIETLSAQPLLKNYQSQPVSSAFFQTNRCLRATGSPCFSDYECAPNKYISNSASAIDSADYTYYASLLNRYEILYWQEELICAQGYSSNQNKCCREIGKKMTTGILLDQIGLANPNTEFPVYDNKGLPGLDIDINSSLRYTKNSTTYALYIDAAATATYPYLSATGNNKCSTGACGLLDPLKLQFNTLQVMNAKTCCGGNWIRNFNNQANGGGHLWGSVKHQIIDKSSFKCLNWRKCTVGKDCNNPQFSCSEAETPDDPICLARSLSEFEAKPYFDWVGTLELTGIPEIAIKSNESTDIRCEVDPTDQAQVGTGTLPNIIADINATNGVYSADGSTTAIKYFNSLDPDVLLGGAKLIFSPDSYTCCLPLGSTTANGDDANICCSGLIKNNRCALNDYADITVYFNLYVSSEGKNVAPNLIDPATGYITNMSTVEELACQKQACASNKIARGVALSNLKIPGHEDAVQNVKRFVIDNSETSKTNAEIAKLYDAGLKWNTHLYCVPEKLVSNVVTGLTVTDCSAYGGGTAAK